LISYERRGKPEGLLGFIFGRQTEYVRRLVPAFSLCLLGFLFSLYVGYYLGDQIPTELLESVLGGFPDLEDFNITMIFLFIIFNNILKSFLWMILGVIGGFPPLVFTVLNGFFLGNFSYSMASEYSLEFIIAALIPHGIIEIPAILLSSAAGMGLGYALINRLRGMGSVKAEFGRAIYLFLTKIVPFLLLAAIVEVTLTPFIVGGLGFI
jgi:stage II sporulation protein M